MTRRRNPFDDVERLFDRLNEQFGESVGVGGGFPVDVEDAGDHYVVTADLPGFETEDIDVQVRDDALHVDATRERDEEDADDTYIRRERSARSVSRRIGLPEAVEEADATARFENGVLTVELPKSGEGSDETRIDIE